MTAHDTVPPATSTGRYVCLRETPHGDLDIVLTELGRIDFQSIDAFRNRYGNRLAMEVLLADHRAAGWELVAPAELDVPVLGPIVAREVERNTRGAVVGAGRVYWYPEFAVYDELDVLHRQGFLELRGSQ